MLRNFFAAAAALFVLLSACVRAQGQSIVGQAGPFGTPISSAQVTEMTEILGFEREQAAQAQELYKGYRAAFRAMVKECDKAMKDAYAKANETQDWSGVQGVHMTQMKEYVTRSTKLEKEFLADLRGICMPEQEARMESAERARRRAVGLRHGLVAGEAVDIVKILRQMKVDTRRADLAETIEEYERSVDRQLIEKDRVLRATVDRLSDPEVMNDQNSEEKLIAPLFKQWGAVGGVLRDINRRTVRTIAPLLTPEEAADFEEKVRSASFPRIYGDRRMEKQFEAAVALAGLTPEQKEKIESLRASFRQAVKPLNDTLAHEVEAMQAKFIGDPLSFMHGGFGQDEEQNPVAKARRARNSLDDEYRKKIAQALTEEQTGKLPDYEARHDHGEREILPDFDGDDDWKNWESEGD